MKINKTAFAVISMFLLSAGSRAAFAGGAAMEQLFKDAGDNPAAADIIARTQALKITPAQVSAEGTTLAGFGDRRAGILAEIETLKVKFQKYENDPLRSGICAAELSRLYLELANLPDGRSA